jgi:uncharacterized protein (TIGR03118 family)
MSQSFRRNLVTAVVVVLALSLMSAPALAQYKAKTLVQSSGKKGDPQLLNPWGLAYGPSQPFWLADEASGLSTLYNGKGKKQSLVVTIPSASGSGQGTPTGIVYNGSSGFKIDNWTSAFLFDTLDGLICGWSQFDPNNALIGVNNSATGAVYTGLAINAANTMIYAADFANNKVDVYNSNFSFVTSFTDSSLPAGFAPFGIQDINGQLYVTFGSQTFGNGGYVDIFTESGGFVKTLISNGSLDEPWGVALAPSNFGSLSDTLLISNNTSTGTINGFSPSTGALMGTIANAKGKAYQFDGLWGIEFGGGSAANGKTNSLYVTAGPSGYAAGEFVVINAK